MARLALALLAFALLALAACHSAASVAAPPMSNAAVAPVGTGPARSRVTGTPPDGSLAILQLALGTSACARMADGTVRCWGGGEDDESPLPTVVSGLEHVVTIWNGATPCAQLVDGTTQCWGDTRFLDDPRADDSVEVPIDRKPHAIPRLRELVTPFVTGGRSEGCGAFSDGAVKCWGSASSTGGISTGEYRDAHVEPVRRELAGARQLSVNAEIGCAVVADRTVRCWGIRARSGRLLDPNHPPPPSTMPDLDHVEQVATGDGFACARLGDGTVSCWGENRLGERGDDGATSNDVPHVVGGVSGIVDLAVGSHHVCALGGDGSVTCWGANGSGQLGLGARSESAPPTRVPHLDHIVQVVASNSTTCALRDDGTAACWGDGSEGAIGDGFRITRTAPSALRSSMKPVVDHGLPSGLGVTAVGVNDSTSCATLSDHTMRCWGEHADDEDPVLTPTPRPWGPLPEDHEDYLIRCTLTHGTATCRSKGAPITQPNVAALTIDNNHLCALLRDGSVTCSTRDTGDGDEELGPFVPIAGIASATQLTGGRDGNCALLPGGVVKCWNYDTSNAVTDATLPGVTTLASGGSGVCAGYPDRTYACWNMFDHRDTLTAPQPVPVPWLTGATQLALGYFHSCALFADGHIGCWGANSFDELGNGSTTAAYVPVRVVW